MNRIALSIAGLRMHFNDVSGGFPSFGVPADHNTFATSDNDKPFISIDCHYAPGPINIKGRGSMLFESGGLWRAYAREGGGVIIEFALPENSSKPYKVLALDEDMRRGELFARDVEAPSFPPITEYPIDEVLMMNLLGVAGGVEVHSAIIDDNGRGYLFAGASGAGKSTIAALWSRDGANVLSDDRVILRLEGGHVRAYGTPWHGEAGVSASGSVELCGIYFLSQSGHNALRPLSAPAAASRMFVTSFPPFWSRNGIHQTLASIETVISAVPAHILEFRKDMSVVEFIRG